MQAKGKWLLNTYFQHICIFPVNIMRISYDMYIFVCKTQNKGWNFGGLLGLEDPNK